MPRLFKITWLILVLSFTLMLTNPASVILASNTSLASYVAVIRITNNYTTDAYNVSVPVTINTSNLVASHYVASNLSNSAMIDNFGNDTYYNPAVVTNTTWVFFVPVIPASSSIDYALYFGGSQNMAGNISYSPGTAGMVAADSANLELSSNRFSINQTGFLDASHASGDAYLIDKSGAISLYVSNPGNITLSLNGTPLVTASNITTGRHTVNVFNTGSQLGIRTDGGQALTRNVSDVNLDGVIDGTDYALVTYYTTHTPLTTDPDYMQYLRCDLNLDGVVNATDETLVNANYIRLLYDLNCDGRIDGTDVTLLQNYLLFNTPVSFKYAGDFNGTGTATIGDVVILGNHLNEGTLDTTSTFGGSSVVNNANTWSFNTNGAWPFLDSQVFYTGYVVDPTPASLMQSIAWQNLAIWVDASGHGNNTTPTFRTTSTNGNVSASLIDFRTSHEAVLTSWSLTNYNSYVKDIPTQPGGMYDGVNPTFPGHSIPDDVATAGNLPTGLFWFLIPCVGLVLLGMGIHDKTRSLMVQATVIGICLVFISLGHVWAFWLLIPYALISGAGVLAGKIYNY